MWVFSNLYMMYVSQIIMPYNLDSAVCPVYLNKIRRGKKKVKQGYHMARQLHS